MLDLFGEPVEASIPHRAGYTHEQKTIERMYMLYSRYPGESTCKECIHFTPKNGDMRGAYFKCDEFTRRFRAVKQGKGGESTDWRRKWPACGKLQRQIRKTAKDDISALPPVDW